LFIYFLAINPRIASPVFANPPALRTGCSIWAVELLRREILLLAPETKINAILIDFFLYDLAKEREREGVEAIPHHRTRSIWY
jgi:hypothetical protein